MHTQQTNQLFLGSLENLRKLLFASSRLSVSLSVRMEQHCSNWTDFHEIL